MNALFDLLNARGSKHREVRSRTMAVLGVLRREAVEVMAMEKEMATLRFHPSGRTANEETARLAFALGLPPVPDDTRVDVDLDIDPAMARNFAKQCRRQIAGRTAGRWGVVERVQRRRLEQKVGNAVVSGGEQRKREAP